MIDNVGQPIPSDISSSSRVSSATLREYIGSFYVVDGDLAALQGAATGIAVQSGGSLRSTRAIAAMVFQLRVVTEIP
jgi:hypothetical protein